MRKTKLLKLVYVIGLITALVLAPLAGQQINAYAVTGTGQDSPESNVFFNIFSVTESTASIKWGTNDTTGMYAKFKIYNNDKLVDEFGPKDNSEMELTGLDASTNYVIRVEGVDASGKVLSSAEDTLTTDEPPTGQVVKFPDDKLTSAVKEYMGIVNRDLYSSDLDILSRLFAENKGITNLSGIEQASSLNQLVVSGNSIQDVSMLSQLGALEYLMIEHNNIQDISGFSALTQISTLDLANNKISNLSPLSGLDNLWTLTISNNQVSDLTPLGSLTKLGGLNASGNYYNSFAPIQNMTSLKSLFLEDTGVSDISFLGSLTNLETVYLENNNITDISVLENLGKLRSVSISNNKLDLTVGSDDFKVIQSLLNRGVQVYYKPHQYLKTGYVSENSALVYWNVLQQKETYTSFEVYVDGNKVKTLGADTKDATLVNLAPSTSYNVKLVGYVGTRKGYEEQITVKTAASASTGGSTGTGGTGNLGSIIMKNPTIIDGVAEIDGLVNETINSGSKIYVTLPEENGQTRAELSLKADQVKKLKDSSAYLNLGFSDVHLSIKASNFPADSDTSIVITKTNLPTTEKVVSSIYNFSVIQNGKYVSAFSTPVKLTFEVDPSKVKNTADLKVYYYNETTQKWEKIGGTYNNGVVTAETNHFSMYAVLEKAEPTNTSGGETSGTVNPGGINSSPAPASGVEKTASGSVKGYPLPNTATESFNYIGVGSLFVLVAFLVMLVQMKRRNKYDSRN